MNGFELLKVLKEDAALSSVPVIMLSARAGEEAKVEGLKSGADDYLTKPFSAKELIARVHTQLGIGKMRDTLEKKVKERTEALERTNADLQYQIQQRKEIEKVIYIWRFEKHKNLIDE